MRVITALTLHLVLLAAAACRPVEAVSTLAVFEGSFADICKSSGKKPVKLNSATRTGDWILVTLDSDPCAKKKYGLSLAGEPSPNLAIIVGAKSNDTRLQRNVDALEAIHRKAGDKTITVMSPTQGDIDRAVEEFAGQNGGFQPKNVTIYMHGHGTEGPDPQLAGVSNKGETYISGGQPTLGNPVVAPVFSNPFPVTAAAKETLTSLKGNGLMGSCNNSLLVVSSCEAGPAVNTIESEKSYWKSIGLDGAIGSSEANQASFDDANKRAGLPSETLLHRIAEARTNSDVFNQLDQNHDRQLTTQEFSDSYDGRLINGLNSSSAVGISDLVEGDGQVEVIQTGLGEPIVQSSQNITLAGNTNAVLASMPSDPGTVSEPE